MKPGMVLNLVKSVCHADATATFTFKVVKDRSWHVLVLNTVGYKDRPLDLEKALARLGYVKDALRAAGVLLGAAAPAPAVPMSLGEALS